MSNHGPWFKVKEIMLYEMMWLCVEVWLAIPRDQVGRNSSTFYKIFKEKSISMVLAYEIKLSEDDLTTILIDDFVIFVSFKRAHSINASTHNLGETSHLKWGTP